MLDGGLLGVFPHPDDETFATGGTFARYHALGVPTAVFTATDGDAGRSAGLADGREALGRLRREELRRAAAELGIGRLYTPGFPDGALDRIAPDEIVAAIVAAIREVRPRVVITFGPEGAPTGHRDHKAISRLTTAAFFLARNPTVLPHITPWTPRRLYYTTWDPAEGWPTEGLPATCRVDVAAWSARKRAAFEAHRTQAEHRAEFERTVTAEEWYALAAGPAEGDGKDLFGGL